MSSPRLPGHWRASNDASSSLFAPAEALYAIACKYIDTIDTPTNKVYIYSLSPPTASYDSHIDASQDQPNRYLGNAHLNPDFLKWASIMISSVIKLF